MKRITDLAMDAVSAAEHHWRTHYSDGDYLAATGQQRYAVLNAARELLAAALFLDLHEGRLTSAQMDAVWLCCR